MTETMPEGCASAAACMLSPRSFTSRTPSSKLMAPGGGRGVVQAAATCVWRKQGQRPERGGTVLHLHCYPRGEAAQTPWSQGAPPLDELLQLHGPAVSAGPRTRIGEGGVLSQRQARAHIGGRRRGLALHNGMHAQLRRCMHRANLDASTATKPAVPAV